MAEERVGEGPVRRETSVVKEMAEERVGEGPVRRETSVVNEMAEKRVREGPVRTTDAASQHPRWRRTRQAIPWRAGVMCAALRQPSQLESQALISALILALISG
jgi:hypothetical protein